MGNPNSPHLLRFVYKVSGQKVKDTAEALISEDKTEYFGAGRYMSIESAVSQHLVAGLGMILDKVGDI